MYATVEDSRGKATVGNGVIVFSLEKKEQQLWGQLLTPEFEDKEFMRKKREEALESAHKRVEEEKKKKAEEKRTQEKYSLRQQMEVWIMYSSDALYIPTIPPFFISVAVLHYHTYYSDG